MPNWSETIYTIDGPKKDLQKLYDILSKLKDKEYLPSDFGKYWLGNFIYLLGCPDPLKYRCRGEIDALKFNGDRLILYMTTAWCEQEDVRKYILKRFPKLHVYVLDTEPGCDVFWSNDIKHKYYTDYAYVYSVTDKKTGNEKCLDQNILSESEFGKLKEKYTITDDNLRYYTYEEDKIGLTGCQ